MKAATSGFWMSECAPANELWLVSLMTKLPSARWNCPAAKTSCPVRGSEKSRAVTPRYPSVPMSPQRLAPSLSWLSCCDRNDALGYQLPTAQSAVEYVAQSGPLTRFWNPASAPRIPMSVDPSLNDQCENAPWTKVSEATGLWSGLAIPASENATSRAPK